MGALKDSFFVVWNPERKAPIHRHSTIAHAQAEAERLARMAPGQTFIVLAPLLEVVRSDIVVTHYDTHEEVPF